VLGQTAGFHTAVVDNVSIYDKSSIITTCGVVKEGEQEKENSRLEDVTSFQVPF